MMPLTGKPNFIRLASTSCAINPYSLREELFLSYETGRSSLISRRAEDIVRIFVLYLASELTVQPTCIYASVIKPSPRRTWLLAVATGTCASYPIIILFEPELRL